MDKTSKGEIGHIIKNYELGAQILSRYSNHNKIIRAGNLFAQLSNIQVHCKYNEIYNKHKC